MSICALHLAPQVGPAGHRRAHALCVAMPARSSRRHVMKHHHRVIVRAAEETPKYDPYEGLEDKISALSESVNESTSGVSIYLIGMMGSGKSTVGKILSKALGYYFFDTDELIEQLAGKSVSEIFAEVGEDEFRSMETEVMKQLAPFKRCIVSTGGGVPTRRENWGLMTQAITIWLNGEVDLLARRVAKDGAESRPLIGESGGATGEEELGRIMERLGSLMEKRRDMYKLADIEVRLEGETGEDLGAPAHAVAWRVLASLEKRIREDGEERERRKDFKITDASDAPNMRVIEQWPSDMKQP